MFVAALTTSVLALVVARQPRQNRQMRALAVMLVIESVLWSSSGLAWSSDAPGQVHAARTVTVMLWVPLITAYLYFLGTLPSPLSRPFGSRIGRLALGGAGVTGAALVVWRIDWFLGPLYHHPLSPWETVWGPGADILLPVFIAAFSFGILVAVSLVRRAAPGTAARQTARTYLTAFAVRDLGIVVSVAYLVARGLPEQYAPADGVVTLLLQAGAPSVYSLLITYGILKYRLFDIDLKIKWTIERGTLVAFFVAFFFVVSELAAVLFAERFGTVLGILAAGALLFALAPLQRLADKVADAAMPQVADTPAYRARRQEAIYEGAIEELLADGAITVKERMALFRLQHDLGLDASQAILIEKRLLESRQPAEVA